jgi:hypothetical protein
MAASSAGQRDNLSLISPAHKGTETMDEQVLTKLVTVDGKIDGILDHLARLNGSVARHEQRLSTMELRCSGEQRIAITVQEALRRIERWQDGVDTDLRALETSLASFRGEKRGVLSTVRDVITVIALGAAIWQGVSAYRSVPTSFPQSAPQAQGR